MGIDAGIADTAMARSNRGVSLVYLTYRSRPRFDWFIDSLSRQLRDDDDLELIFVDGLLSSERELELRRAVAGRFEYRHLAAKPSPYRGPHRLTSRDCFAAASARNTGIVYATKPYVVFVDDASVLMPGWLDEVRKAARGGYVVTGAYEKYWEMAVEDGILVAGRGEPQGRDVRWEQGDEERAVQIGGGQLYGCSCGAPRDLLVAVNGFDELCDPIGGEDWHLGLRLDWFGAPIYYDRAMLTIESEELHREGEPALRVDKAADAQFYMQRLLDFGVEERSSDGNYDSSHLVLDVLYGTHEVRSIGNYYDLAELNEANLLDTIARFPRYHWFDQQPLDEM